MNPTLRRARLLSAWNAIGSVVQEVTWRWPSQTFVVPAGKTQVGKATTDRKP